MNKFQGGVAIVSLLTGTVIDKMVLEHFHNGTNTTESEFRVSIACQLSLLVGAIQLLMGLIGIGLASSLFSDTFISGYTCASAFHVVMSQLKDLFGITKLQKFDGIFKIPKVLFSVQLKSKLYSKVLNEPRIFIYIFTISFKSLFDFFSKIYTSNWITVAFSFACIVFLIFCKEFTNPVIKRRFHFEFPSELVLVII